MSVSADKLRDWLDVIERVERGGLEGLEDDVQRIARELHREWADAVVREAEGA